jgi:hypothetical protein
MRNGVIYMDTNYVKENMGTDELGASVIKNSVFAIISTMLVIGAILVPVWALPYVSLKGLVFMIAFASITTLVFVYLVRTRMAETSETNWFFVRSIDREAMAAYGFASLMAGLCVIAIAVIVVDVVTVEVALLSVAPTAAGAYMMRKAFADDIRKLAVASVSLGLITGLGMKCAGIVIALSIDVFGPAVTAAAIIIDITFTAVYLYIDLTEWVRSDMESKISEAKREEARREILEMVEIARNLGIEVPEWKMRGQMR